jgi:hypothetical protein
MELMAVYRAARDGKDLGKSKIGEPILGRLLELLEEMVKDVEKKEAEKRH